MFEPLYERPQPLYLDLDDLTTLPIEPWKTEFRYIPKKFHGQILIVNLQVKTAFIQWMRPVCTSSRIVKFAYYPEYGRDGTTRALTREWEKHVRRFGIKEPEQRRYAKRLSKRMCRGAYNPAYREQTLRTQRSRMWQKRYREYIEPYARFTKPETEQYLEATLTIQPPLEYGDVLVDITLAYDPFVNMRSDVWWSINGGSWNKAGLTGRAREAELKKVEKACHRYRNRDLFEEE